MPNIVDGFQNQLWILTRYDSLNETEIARFPADKMSYQGIALHIEALARQHLNEAEMKTPPSTGPLLMSRTAIVR